MIFVRLWKKIELDKEGNNFQLLSQSYIDPSVVLVCARCDSSLIHTS